MVPFPFVATARLPLSTGLSFLAVQLSSRASCAARSRMNVSHSAAFFLGMLLSAIGLLPSMARPRTISAVAGRLVFSSGGVSAMSARGSGEGIACPRSLQQPRHLHTQRLRDALQGPDRGIVAAGFEPVEMLARDLTLGQAEVRRRHWDPILGAARSRHPGLARRAVSVPRQVQRRRAGPSRALPSGVSPSLASPSWSLSSSLSAWPSSSRFSSPSLDPPY